VDSLFRIAKHNAEANLLSDGDESHLVDQSQSLQLPGRVFVRVMLGHLG